MRAGQYEPVFKVFDGFLSLSIKAFVKGCHVYGRV